jgi:hypothetical protein
MNYAEIQTALCGETGNCPAEQWHGLMCGLICSGRPTSVDLLSRLMLEITGLEEELQAQQITMLEQLLQETGQQLSAGNLDFNPLLPGEEESLAQRTRALGDWCDSFLFGLSAGGLNNETGPAPDVGEFIADLSEISHAEFESDVDREDDEYYYNELVEYVRVGALLVNDECNPIEPARPREH